MKFSLTSMQNRSFIEWLVTKSVHPSPFFMDILISNLKEIRWIVSNVNHEVRYSYTFVMHFMSDTHKYSSKSQLIPFTLCDDVCRFKDILESVLLGFLWFKWKHLDRAIIADCGGRCSLSSCLVAPHLNLKLHNALIEFDVLAFVMCFLPRWAAFSEIPVSPVGRGSNCVAPFCRSTNIWMSWNIYIYIYTVSRNWGTVCFKAADLNDRALWGVVVRPLDGWHCGFVSR